MTIDKQEFLRRLERATDRARDMAERYVIEHLPRVFLYLLPAYDDPKGSRGPTGTIKYFGGRFLKPEDLVLVTAARAADLLWVDGRVPAWVNISVTSVDGDKTHIRVRCSHDLLPVERALRGRDLYVDPEDPVEPFRIRGPGVPNGWRSVEQDGKISLLAHPDAG